MLQYQFLCDIEQALNFLEVRVLVDLQVSQISRSKMNGCKTRQQLLGKQGHTSRIQQLQKNACRFWRLTALSATRHSAMQRWLRVVRMSWYH